MGGVPIKSAQPPENISIKSGISDFLRSPNVVESTSSLSSEKSDRGCNLSRGSVEMNYPLTDRRRQSMLQNLVHEEYCRAITEVYDLSGGQKLGSGCFGKVQIVKHRATNEYYALKTVALERVKDKNSINSILREVNIMKNLDHPNIVRLQEVFHAPTYLFLVMDLCTGGNLMETHCIYSENEAANIVKSVVNAIRYCHDRNIAHRDLKLENIVREHNGFDAEVKLVDFGLSCHFREAELQHDVVGTWIYMAPEVISGSHFPTACDMWSIGVITYLILCGYPPFIGQTRDELIWHIKHGTFQFHPGSWRHISDLGKNFIRRLLVRNYRERMTAAEAQHHPWLNKNFKSEPEIANTLPKEVVENIVKFREQNLLKKLALKSVARTLESDLIKKLQREFKKVDTSENGVISLTELHETLKKTLPDWEKADSGIISEDSANALFKKIVYSSNNAKTKAVLDGVAMDGSTSLSFNDFMAASMSRRFLDEKTLRLAFDRLDYDHSGAISVHNLELVVGEKANDEALKAAINEWDRDGDGVIDFREFCKAMLKNDFGAFELATMRNNKFDSKELTENDLKLVEEKNKMMADFERNESTTLVGNSEEGCCMGSSFIERIGNMLEENDSSELDSESALDSADENKKTMHASLVLSMKGLATISNAL